MVLAPARVNYGSMARSDIDDGRLSPSTGAGGWSG